MGESLSSNFGQIPPLTPELSALEHLKNLMYNVVTTPALLFFILSSSVLQVMRKTIKAWMSSNFSQIRLQTAKLAALERLKKIPIDLQWEKCCDHFSAFIFEWIFFILAGKKNNHKVLNAFEFRPHPTTDYGVSCPLASEKSMFYAVSTLVPSFLIGSSSFLPVIRTTIKA